MSLALKDPGASEVLARVLASGTVPADVLLECLYYAAEPGLLEAMRELSRLDDDERERAVNAIRAIGGESHALRLLLRAGSVAPTEPR